MGKDQTQLFNLIGKEYFIFPTFKPGNKQTLATYVIDEYQKSPVNGKYSVIPDTAKNYIRLGQSYAIHYNMTLQYTRNGKYPEF